MFDSATQLTHLLPPAAYESASFYSRESQAVFDSAWHFFGVTHDVARPGQYFAADVRDVPVVVRNIGGELHAFKNVCLHRHSRIVAGGSGSGTNIRCQYHGWEYGDAGQIAKIPDGRSFKGLQAKDWCLTRYRLETLGSLIFVNLSTAADGLRESLGDAAEEIDYFYGNHDIVWRTVAEYPVNWKIVVENAVESYHVPLLHPGTFDDYKREEFHDHRLEPAYTSYLDTEPISRSPIDLVLSTLTKMTAPTIRFQRAKHVNIFPHHLLYFLELYSIFSTAEPLGPARTRFTVVAFVPRKIRFPLLNRPIQRLFRLALHRMWRRIMAEDQSIWNEVQHGISHSDAAGVLSCREERVYALQKYVSDAVAKLG